MSTARIPAADLDGLLPENAAPPTPELPAGTSWAPVDLEPVLNGEQLTEPPTMLERTDGVNLIYPGRVHAFNAESESAKTWLALHAAAELLPRGEHVLYLDFEDSAASIVERLLALGVPTAAIRDYFTYVSPDEPLGANGPAREDFEFLLDPPPTLVVADGLTEAFTLQGLDGNVGDSVAKWLDAIPRPFKKAGAAVVLIDHVVKDPKSQGRFATGSQHKLAGVDVAYGLKVIKPFGRGVDGHVRLTVEKDRPGHVRQHATGKAIADIHFTSDNGGGVTVELHPPGADTATTFRPTGLMQRISIFIEQAREPLSKRAILDEVTGKREYKVMALAILIAEGYIDAAAAGNGKATQHTTIRPYREAEETDRGPVAEPWPNRGPATAEGNRGPVAHHALTGGGTRATPQDQATTEPWPDEPRPESIPLATLEEEARIAQVLELIEGGQAA